MRIRTTVAAAIAATALALTGCSSGDAGNSETTPSNPDTTELTQVDLGLIPLMLVAPVYLGMEQGYFEEEGIELTPAMGQGGAALVPAVISGEYDIAFSNNLSLLVAREAGLPLTAIAAGVASTGAPDEGDFSCLLVSGDSDLGGMKDLEGQLVAVSQLQSFDLALVRDLVDREGGDSSKVEFVEVAHPDIPAAVANEQVAAAVTSEPFQTLAQREGSKCLSYIFAEPTSEPLTIGSYFTSEEFAAENPELVEGFARAIAKSISFAAENPDEVRRIIPTFTQISEDLAAEVTLPGWPEQQSRESWEYMSEIGVRYGILKESANIEEAIYGGLG